MADAEQNKLSSLLSPLSSPSATTPACITRTRMSGIKASGIPVWNAFLIA